MREILFRGRTTKGAEWVSGFYAEYSTAPFIGAPNPQGTMLWFEVDPETVGQFTGLTDKNGKRIFEGDIIKTDNGKKRAFSVVKYGNFRPNMIFRLFRSCCGITPQQDMSGVYCESTTEQFALFDSPACIEVIGNVTDKPELLEVDE